MDELGCGEKRGQGVSRECVPGLVEVGEAAMRRGVLQKGLPVGGGGVGGVDIAVE